MTAKHEPTEDMRKTVTDYAAVGVPQDDIALLCGISKNTLRKHYEDELKFGGIKANAAVAGALYNKAMKGDTTSQIFWLKTRAKWSEKIDLGLTDAVKLVINRPGGD